MNWRTNIVLILGLLAVASCGMAAAPGMTAESILSKWQAAAKAESQPAGGTHLTAELKASGLTGTYEEWTNGNDKYRFRLDLGNGLFIQDVIMAGDSAWQRDKTGKVSPLEGVDLQRTNSSRFFTQGRQFTKDHGGAKLEVVDADSTSTVGLRITPPNGVATTYYFDSRWLPHHSTTPSDERVTTTWYEDYKEVSGAFVSAFSRQRTGTDSRYDVETKLLTLETGVNIPDEMFVVEISVPKDFHFSSGDRALNIPIEISGNHIYVPVSINGKPRKWFVLDTGAEMGVINKSVAEELALPMSGDMEGRGGGEQSISVSLVSNLTLEVEGASVTGQTLAGIGLDALEPKIGRRMEGILGSEFFHRFVVQIDYEKKLLNLYDPATFVYEGTEQPIPIILESNLPMINITFQVAGCKKSTGKFLMDTGANSAIDISAPKVEADGLAECASKTYAGNISYGVGGASKQLVARTDIVDFGSQSVPSLIGSLMQDKSGAGASKDRDGLVGGELFKHFTITFDYTGRRIWLKPNGQFSEVQQQDMSGMKFEAHGKHFDTITVAVVIPGSIAEQAGIKPGDQLVSIGGKSVTGMTLEDVKAKFCVASQGIKVEYLSEGKTSSATLKLEPLI